VTPLSLSTSRADSLVIYCFGRRTLYTVGMGTMAVVLIIIGGLGFTSSTSATYAIGSLLIALNFIYNATLGPLCYTIIGEMSATRLRQKSIVLARIAYQLMNIICGIIVSTCTDTYTYPSISEESGGCGIHRHGLGRCEVELAGSTMTRSDLGDTMPKLTPARFPACLAPRRGTGDPNPACSGQDPQACPRSTVSSVFQRASEWIYPLPATNWRWSCPP
jgi:hypothetical protein